MLKHLVLNGLLKYLNLKLKKVENEKSNPTAIFIVLFILIIVTSMAFYDEDQKINRLKSTVFVYTNRFDSLIEDENKKNGR